MTPNGTPVINWAEGKIWVNNHAHIIAEIDGVLLRYLFHYLQTIDVKPLIHGNIPKLTGGDFKALKIPVPPLPVQSEIVRILDNFTELTAELTDNLGAEAAAREKQYEYYRDELLKPKADIPMVTLKEIATDIYRGSGIKRDQVTEAGIPCVRYGEIYTTYNTWFDECVSHTQKAKLFMPVYHLSKKSPFRCLLWMFRSGMLMCLIISKPFVQTSTSVCLRRLRPVGNSMNFTVINS